MGQLPEVLCVWIALCFLWKGTGGFMIINGVKSLCLEDSLSDAGVQLRRCSVDSDLQQWVWLEHWFLMNVQTQRCLSAFRDDPVRTLDCDSGDQLQWQCMNQRLISSNHSLELGLHRERLALTITGKSTRWKTVDAGDICQERLRSRRHSEANERADGENTMTDEQREYLRWYYRTEDSTSWTFAMLALSLLALLMGCVFCVMGMMGNKHRKKIAQYKAAAVASPAMAKIELEELRDLTELKEKNSYAVASPALAKIEMEELQDMPELKEKNSLYADQIDDDHLNSTVPVEGANVSAMLKPGEIVVLYKDGTVNNLYPNPPEEEQDEK